MQHHIETLKSYLPGLIRGFGSQKGLKLVFCGNVEAFANDLSCSANDALVRILPAGSEGHDACVAAIAALVVASSEQVVEFDTGRFDRSNEQNPTADTENRYASTGQVVGNDVIRMIAAIASLSFGLDYPADSNSPLMQDFRKDLWLYSPTEIVWEPEDTTSSQFDSQFAQMLDQVVCNGSHPSFGDGNEEYTSFLTGRIGNLAVVTEIGIFGNSESGMINRFHATNCGNNEDAVFHCRTWANAEVKEYLNESNRVAINFAGQILGRGDRDTNIASISRDAAAQFAGELSGRPMDEDALTEFFAERIADGEWDSDDIPRRMARFGLMDPASFLLEMQERKAMREEELAGGDDSAPISDTEDTKPAPETHDDWWVDDTTGDYVRSSDGKRFSAEDGRTLIQGAKALQAARLLVDAYAAGAANSSSIEWDDVDLAFEAAKEVFPEPYYSERVAAFVADNAD